MNQFPRDYGTCPEMQFSQTLLALDGCILFWWMRYLLRGSVFLHCRQEKLLFKIYLSMIGKHKTLHGFKFQVAGHCQKYQGIKAPRHWVLIAGQRSPLLSLPPGSLNSWVIILKTALMETHVDINVRGCPGQGKNTLALWICMLSFMVHDHMREPLSTVSVWFFVIDWRSHDSPGRQDITLHQLLQKILWWTWMAHCLGYYSDWELSRNSCLKLLLQLLRKSCLPMVWETCIW